MNPILVSKDPSNANSRAARATESHLSKWLSRAKTMAALAFAIFVVIAMAPAKATACRDCPFPMKVGEGRWLMPNRQLEVAIDEFPSSATTRIITVTLVDSHSMKILATGWTTAKNSARTIKVSLWDKQHRPIQATIYFLDRDRIQVKFYCDGCSITEMLR